MTLRDEQHPELEAPEPEVQIPSETSEPSADEPAAQRFGTLYLVTAVAATGYGFVVSLLIRLC